MVRVEPRKLSAAPQHEASVASAGCSSLCLVNASEALVEVVVPVHDEEQVLGPNVDLLVDYLRREFPAS
jgi:hypothetical protein